jgi:(p)ppGpp synthase/HD superfamily hydrolase
MDVEHLITTSENAFERLLLVHPDLQKAYAYADAAHSADDQRRKFTNRPYIEHPRMVAAILLTALPKGNRDNATPIIADFAPLQAALLHDVIEDTAVTPEDLLRHFSGEVVGLVEELTEPDDPLHWLELGHEGRPNRVIRRAIEAERRSTISDMAQTISCADIIANSHDIVEHAPHDFAVIYQRELLDRLIAMERANSQLWLIAEKLVGSNLERLKEHAA